MKFDNALPTGTMVESYELTGVLGAGGFGITYRAIDTHLQAPVAVKEYFPAALALRTSQQTVVSRPEFGEGSYSWGRDRFIQEAMALASLRHPNIVGVDYLFQANGTAYMSLDFVDGPTLGAWLRSLEAAPDQDQVYQLLLPLLDALELVHASHLLHRDITPRNIMISAGMSPVLIDFGAARQLVAANSRTFAAILSPGYAPFEQYSPTGKGQGPWTDIYAVAATFYQAITGSAPLDAPDRMMEDRSLPAAIAGRGRYSETFLEALDWALSPRPQSRPRSVAEWRDALGLAAPMPLANMAGAAIASPGEGTRIVGH
ncbi:MAG: serine/threonine-protein kinase [Hyphomicrobiaceae bacterium]